MFKKSLFTLIALYQSLFIVSANDDIRSAIIPEIKGQDRTSIATKDWLSADWTQLLDRVFAFITDSIFGLLALISVGMFLYIGFKLVSAQWNPEELKKTFVTLVYVIVWLAIVSVSWLVINILTWISL